MFDNKLSDDIVVFPCGMSRSGTTLLTTVLDSHSQMSLGYELLPAELSSPETLLHNLQDASDSTASTELVELGKYIKDNVDKAEGLFAVRVARSGVDFNSYVRILEQLIEKSFGETKSLRDRFRLSYEIVKEKSKIENSSVCGFKLNNSSYAQAKQLFPNSHYIYTLRDPRDVWASHVQRGFKRTVEEVCKAWIVYLEKFEKFRTLNPDISVIIKYEDLVASPRSTIERIFSVLPTEVESQVFEFYKSDASVYKTGHPNIEQLSQNFFTSSVNRWVDSISREESEYIIKLCGKIMRKYGYDV